MSVSEFVINVYYFFNGWPKRCEEFTNIQTKIGVNRHKFMKHCSSRWLTLGKAALRVIEQWDCLIEYFTVFIPKKCSNLMTASRYLSIVKQLKNPLFKAEIYFVINSASLYENFSILFQRQEPLIHVLYDELKKLLLIIAGRVCKPNVLIKWSGSESVFDNNNLLTIPQLPSEVSGLLNTTKEIEKKIFIDNVKKHYVNGAKHILNKSSYGVSPKIKYLRCLQPQEIKKEQSCYDIDKVARFLPVNLDKTMLSDEWKLLKLENLTYVSGQRIDHYWRQVFNLKNTMDEPKFPLITTVVKCALSLSHGSADVERGFSISGKVLTEVKSAMSCKMLN